MKKQICAAGLLFFCSAVVARAQIQSQPYVWKSVKITAGGFITGIVFSPKESGLAYCRTDIGGAYRFDAKLKEWVCLTDWVGPRNANFGGCESVAADPNDAEKVYLALGTYSRGSSAIARSADHGKTFAVATLPIAMGANEDGRGMGERLAVDPSDGRVLYFGSRRNGLWRSTDGAATWSQVTSFPTTAGAAGVGAPGIPWVIFEARKEDNAGTPTQSIFAGLAGGSSSLYHSSDTGKTWSPIASGPEAGMMPHRAVLDAATQALFISYGNGPGPNNVTAGAVFKYDINTAKWTNITPNNPGTGGFGGIALDPQKPGTLMVSTIDHWSPADEIFRSSDYGATWKPIAATADRQTTGTPYMANLLRGHRFDWWLAALAIDPFDSNHVLFGTGATIWGTHDMADFDAGKGTRWNIEADGIEETAVLALASPPWGAHLISGVGDIGGFTHEDLTVSPTAAHTNPMFSNTNSIEFAELKPVVVRTGTANRNGGGQTAAYSEDGGITWRPLQLPAAVAGTGRGGGGGGMYLTVSADGSTLLAAAGATVSISKDKGATWTASTGLFAGAQPFADRMAPTTFYALDAVRAQIYSSTDGGATFTPKPAAGLPADNPPRGRGAGGGSRIKASFASQGDLWLLSGGNLYRSADAGVTFTRLTTNITITNFALSKAASNHASPALFVTGTLAGVQAIFRSDDSGITWLRINDDQHQFGGTPTVIAADPRIFGRLYIGMNGRGILYGDPQTP